MRRIKLFLLLFALVSLTIGYQPLAAQEITTFILVRHAEKAADGTKDPALNEAGKKRAAALAHHLKETDITSIYSTPYNRTMQTVQAIAEAKGLKVKTYDSSSDTVINDIIKNNTGGTVLLLGHSNTTPMFVNQLIGEERYKQLEEDDYDNFFIVMTQEVGKGKAIKIIL